MGFPRRAPAAAPVLGLAARWPSPPPRPAPRASGERGPVPRHWLEHRFGGFGGAGARGRLLRGEPTPTFARVPSPPQPYTSRPIPATDRSGPTQSCVSFDAVYMLTTEVRSHFLPISASVTSDYRLRRSEIWNASTRFIRPLGGVSRGALRWHGPDLPAIFTSTEYSCPMGVSVASRSTGRRAAPRWWFARSFRARTTLRQPKRPTTWPSR